MSGIRVLGIYSISCNTGIIIKKMNEGKVHGNKIPEQQSMIIILRNKRVIDKIKTETAVMKRVLSTVDSWCEIAEFIIIL